MDMKNLMDTNRLEAFYDAIITIIVTVLVLELPQFHISLILSVFLFASISGNITTGYMLM